MAECRCGTCEHCVAPHRYTPFTGTPAVHDTLPAPPPSHGARSLLTPARLAFLRGPMGGGRMLTAEECRELADAYETAERLLVEVVREARIPFGASPGVVLASDVAWLKLREAGVQPAK